MPRFGNKILQGLPNFYPFTEEEPLFPSFVSADFVEDCVREAMDDSGKKNLPGSSSASTEHRTKSSTSSSSFSAAAFAARKRSADEMLSGGDVSGAESGGVHSSSSSSTTAAAGRAGSKEQFGNKSNGMRNAVTGVKSEGPETTARHGGEDVASPASTSSATVGGNFASPSSVGGMMGLSRDMRNKAEKLRRDKLNTHILKLGDLLPAVNMTPKRMDKTSVLRLASNFLRCHRSILTPMKGKTKDEWPQGSKIEQILEGFEGFMVILTGTGKILYISEAVEKMFGHSQVDLLGNYIFNIIHPDDVKAFALSLRPTPGITGLREYRKLCCRIAERSLSRSEPCRYVFMSVSGLLKHISDVPNRPNNKASAAGAGGSAGDPGGQTRPDACSSTQPDRVPLRFLPSIIGRQAERSMPIYALPDDWLFIALVTPVRSTSIVELSLFQATQDEYFTRHCLDGRIINADQRISIVAGFTVSEVIGHSGFAYIIDDDKAMTAILHHDMLYSSRDGSTVVTYRLRSKSNGYIYLKTKGYLEFNRNSSTCESFICINTLLGPEEGMMELRKQVEQYRASRLPMINAYASSLSNGGAGAYGMGGQHVAAGGNGGGGGGGKGAGPWFGGPGPAGPNVSAPPPHFPHGHAPPYAAIFSSAFAQDAPLYPAIPPYAAGPTYQMARGRPPGAAGQHQRQSHQQSAVAAAAAAAAAAVAAAAGPVPVAPNSLGPFSTHTPTLPVPLSIPITHRNVSGPPPFALEAFNGAEAANNAGGCGGDQPFRGLFGPPSVDDLRTPGASGNGFQSTNLPWNSCQAADSHPNPYWSGGPPSANFANAGMSRASRLGVMLNNKHPAPDHHQHHFMEAFIASQHLSGQGTMSAVPSSSSTGVQQNHQSNVRDACPAPTSAHVGANGPTGGNVSSMNSAETSSGHQGWPNHPASVPVHPPKHNIHGPALSSSNQPRASAHSAGQGGSGETSSSASDAVVTSSSNGMPTSNTHFSPVAATRQQQPPSCLFASSGANSATAVADSTASSSSLGTNWHNKVMDTEWGHHHHHHQQQQHYFPGSSSVTSAMAHHLQHHQQADFSAAGNGFHQWQSNTAAAGQNQFQQASSSAAVGYDRFQQQSYPNDQQHTSQYNNVNGGVQGFFPSNGGQEPASIYHHQLSSGSTGSDDLHHYNLLGSGSSTSTSSSSIVDQSTAASSLNSSGSWGRHECRPSGSNGQSLAGSVASADGDEDDEEDGEEEDDEEDGGDDEEAAADEDDSAFAVAAATGGGGGGGGGSRVGNPCCGQLQFHVGGVTASNVGGWPVKCSHYR